MSSNLFNSAMQAYKDIAERTKNGEMLKMINNSWNADTQRYEVPNNFEKSEEDKNASNRRVSESIKNDVIYLGEIVSEEKAKEIVDNAQYTMTNYRDAEFNFGVAKGVGGSNPYTIWIYDTDTFIHCNYEKAVEVLQDLEGAIEKENNEEKEYARNAIPTLWKMFKNGTWRDGEYISDFFSDYYKEVFGHRPHTANQIENELTKYSKELGIELTESLEESFDDFKEYRVNGYGNRWSIINDYIAEDGKHYALLENNEWGDETCYLVVELGTEKMKNYTSRKTGETFDLPTFDTVIAETYDSLLTALADADVISYEEAERHMDESCKIQKKIENLEEQLNELKKLIK